MIPDVTPNGVFYLPPTGWLTSFYNPPYGEGKEQIHVIIKNSKTGKDISEYNTNEQEVLFPRNTRFKVEKFYVNDNGILTIVWSE